jgi:NAD(P)H-dependent flavin oxidoreductase YrpB (nitropropane dioxygenase family)
MIRTRDCDLLEIDYPIALGGMGGGHGGRRLAFRLEEG